MLDPVQYREYEYGLLCYNMQLRVSVQVVMFSDSCAYINHMCPVDEPMTELLEEMCSNVV